MEAPPPSLSTLFRILGKLVSALRILGYLPGSAPIYVRRCPDLGIVMTPPNSRARLATVARAILWPSTFSNPGRANEAQDRTLRWDPAAHGQGLEYQLLDSPRP